MLRRGADIFWSATCGNQPRQGWCARSTTTCCQLLQKGYQDYHKQDSGEYLSWMTNDVKQIEQLAWNPLF